MLFFLFVFGNFDLDRRTKKTRASSEVFQIAKKNNHAIFRPSQNHGAKMIFLCRYNVFIRCVSENEHFLSKLDPK